MMQITKELDVVGHHLIDPTPKISSPDDPWMKTTPFSYINIIKHHIMATK
jgi:hypothetical protein